MRMVGCTDNYTIQLASKLVEHHPEIFEPSGFWEFGVGSARSLVINIHQCNKILTRHSTDIGRSSTAHTNAS